MRRIMLRALNAPALILIALLGMSFQTAFFSWEPLSYIKPDIILFVVIWCALKRDFVEGGLIVLIVGHLAELHSGVPKGLFLSAMIALYLLMKFIGKIFLIAETGSFVGLTIFGAFFISFTLLSMLYSLGAQGFNLRQTLVLIPLNSFVQGFYGNWVYHWLSRFDLTTYKDPRVQNTLEDEYLLSDEGL